MSNFRESIKMLCEIFAQKGERVSLEEFVGFAKLLPKVTSGCSAD